LENLIAPHIIKIKIQLIKMTDLGKFWKKGKYFDTKIVILKKINEIVIALNKDIASLVETYDQEKE
jgi:hypothetical protein